jgi:hypothetical protein
MAFLVTLLFSIMGILLSGHYRQEDLKADVFRMSGKVILTLSCHLITVFAQWVGRIFPIMSALVNLMFVSVNPRGKWSAWHLTFETYQSKVTT